ncbi:hypothetical protein ASD11_02110 [Aeromicrobium sp. Root495]|uniref:TetR/AcrR family transcriptional regulator n=1 Tax=Aeromicrobium sp. Root495 TaxID=1736550 RepID=UPI0006F85EA6|nr:hypothetical protein [Aeromicrobium sp. Root495]KQY58481.1 hypothetical protein ASD11_02110 [Aeromicrobium sp. Root495]RYJ05767.1 MAG: TetR/AcrR family transcriptional regulator [Actinomycetales bacterium]
MAVPRQHNTDGRIARGERTRDAIVAAHTELVREGVLKPTGKAIAERAGISLRTVWLNYKDLEALLVATTGYWLEADLELRVSIDADLPLEERIEAYVAMRVARLEHLAPAARSAALGEPFSAALQESRRQHVDRVQGDADEVFAQEVAAAGERREVLRKALFIASSWPSWSSLRHDFGLGVEESADVMRSTLTTLLRPQ